MPTTSQERFYEALLERVRDDQYPSGALLDRLEAGFWNSEQLVAYVELLMDKIEESWYPSGQLLDRAQRMLTIVAATS